MVGNPVALFGVGKDKLNQIQMWMLVARRSRQELAMLYPSSKQIAQNTNITMLPEKVEDTT